MRTHRLRRGFVSSKFDVTEIWDLLGVEPLFNIPSCALFLSPKDPQPLKNKAGRVLRGRLPRKDIPLDQAAPHLHMTDCEYELAFLGRRSAWRPVDPAKGTLTLEEWLDYRPNPYVLRFRQGADPVPADPDDRDHRRGCRRTGGNGARED